MVGLLQYLVDEYSFSLEVLLLDAVVVVVSHVPVAAAEVMAVGHPLLLVTD